MSEVVRNQQTLLFDKSIYSQAEKHYAEVTEVSGKMLMLYLLKLSVPMLLTFALMGYLFLT